MAECHKSELAAAQSDSADSQAAAVVDISEWTNDQHEEAKVMRSSIMDVILNSFEIKGNQSKDHLRTILDSGWDVNETFLVHGSKDDKQVHKTALHMAAERDCAEAVEILLDAGAKCVTSDVLQNPLVAALENQSPDILELLLTHGADPNDHDGQFENIPLLRAINTFNWGIVRMVKILLEHGADPNVTAEHGGYMYHTLYAALEARFNFCDDLFKNLVLHGADVNHQMDRKPSVLYTLLGKCSMEDHNLHQLQLFFKHGGNISIEDRDLKTPMEYAVRRNVHRYKIRWLLKHGADTSALRMYMFREHFISDNFSNYDADIPLVLLQAGMRVPHATQKQLLNLETAISAWLKEHWASDIDETTLGMVQQLGKDEEEELQRLRRNSRRHIYPESSVQQLADLEEFSDETLDDHPYKGPWQYWMKRGEWERRRNEIHTMLQFLRQTQSLQWYSRQCLRENLVSLQPSLVNNLPIPKRMKRYILCHEL